MRIGFGKCVLMAGAALALTPLAAQAQTRDLDSETSDVRMYQGTVDGAPQRFEVTIPANVTLQIDVMATSDLDPTLRVLDARNQEVLIEDDDGGEGLNSRARVAGEDGRRVIIEVDSYDASWVEEGETYGGSFSLQLSYTTFVPHQTQPIDFGGRAEGEMTGVPNLYTIQGAAGEMVEIALTSPDGMLDPYLELRDASGETVAYNDDNGFNLNSLVRHVFDETGTYTIAVTGYGETTGSYVLRVNDRRVASAQLPLQVIGIADEASGELSSAWAEDTLTPSRIDYQLSDAAIAAIRGGAGEVTIRMNAVGEADPDFGNALDPLVELGFETPLGFASVTYDDDSGGELNSALPIDLGALADNPDMLSMLRIRAHGFGGSAGAYTLVISEGMDPMVEAAAEGDF